MRCLSESQVGSVTVLTLAKPILGDVETRVTDRVRDLLQQGHRKFLLNLAEVTWLDSHGLGDLVAASQAASKASATLGLCHVHEHVSEPLRIMKVLKEFETFDTQEEGLKSFA